MTELRFAQTAEEREEIYRFRFAIYREELRVALHCDETRGQMADADDLTARHAYAVDDGRIVGVVRVNMGKDGPFSEELAAPYHLEQFAGAAPHERMTIISRLAVEPGHRGTQATSMLIFAAAQIGVTEGTWLGFLDCRPHLVHTYLSLGFRVCGPAFNHAFAGLSIPMVAVVPDVAHFRALGSPFLVLIEPQPYEPGVRERLLAALSEDVGVVSITSEDAARNIAQELGRLPSGGIVEGLDEGNLARLVLHGHVIDCRAGDLIIRAGGLDRGVYLIVEGSVEVRRDGRPVERIGPGNIVGAIGFLLGGQRTADVRAVSERVRVLYLQGTRLKQLPEEAPALASRFFRNVARGLAARLAFARSTL